MDRKIIAEERPPEAKMTPSGSPQGMKMKDHACTRLYEVTESGAFKRLTPKPLSKKERRKSKKLGNS